MVPTCPAEGSAKLTTAFHLPARFRSRSTYAMTRLSLFGGSSSASHRRARVRTSAPVSSGDQAVGIDGTGRKNGGTDKFIHQIHAVAGDGDGRHGVQVMSLGDDWPNYVSINRADDEILGGARRSGASRHLCRGYRQRPDI